MPASAARRFVGQRVRHNGGMTTAAGPDVPSVPPHPLRSLAWAVPWAALAALSLVTIVQHPPRDAETWRAAGFFPVLLVASLAVVVLLVVRAFRSVARHRAFVAQWGAAERREFSLIRYARERATPPLVAGVVAGVLAVAGLVLVLVFLEPLGQRPGALSSALAVVLLVGMLAVRMLESGVRRRRASRSVRAA